MNLSVFLEQILLAMGRTKTGSDGTLGCEINHKTQRSWYKLYGDPGVVALIARGLFNDSLGLV
eukprot:1982676-Rhodomonas_salina.3